MSKRSDRKSLAEIKRNVKEMLRDSLRYVDAAVDRCQQAGIIQDHRNASGPFTVPRDFLEAFCGDIRLRYRNLPSKERSKRVKNYSLFI